MKIARLRNSACWSKAAKVGAALVLLVCAALLRVVPLAKRAISLFLPNRLSGVLKQLDSIPRERLRRCVLFLSLRPHARETRLAAAARLAGWEPVLVHTGKANYDPGRFFSFHAQVGGLLQLVAVSWWFRGPLVHVFAPDGAHAYLLCATKTRPLILDPYDTCSGYASSPALWRRCERAAMRAADGMTHRDLRVKYLQDLHGYALPRHNILIHDPLPESRGPISASSTGAQIPLTPSLSPSNGERVSEAPLTPSLSPSDGERVAAGRERGCREIRVVSAGWVGKGDNSILRITRALCAGRVHVHMYVNPFQHHGDPEMADYFKLREQSEYFHIEQPVYGETYLEQLARYDFGLALCEPLVFGETPKDYTADYLRGCGSSRIVDYIQTGLGVIVSTGTRFQVFFARRYAAAVVMATPEFLANPRPALEAALRAKAAAKPKNVTTITTQGVARRLDRFYSRVAAQA